MQYSTHQTHQTTKPDAPARGEEDPEGEKAQLRKENKQESYKRKIIRTKPTRRKHLAGIETSLSQADLQRCKLLHGLRTTAAEPSYPYRALIYVFLQIKKSERDLNKETKKC